MQWDARTKYSESSFFVANVRVCMYAYYAGIEISQTWNALYQFLGNTLNACVVFKLTQFNFNIHICVESS